jgi:hypothetical protein
MRNVRPALWVAAVALVFAGLSTVRASDFTTPISMPGAIKGAQTIDFQTRVQLDDTGSVPDGSPKLGVADTYVTELEIAKSVVLKGEIHRVPWLPSRILGRTYQEGYLEYDMRLILRNPNDASKTITLGGWIGAMSLDGDGLYNLTEAPEGKGQMRIAVDPVGKIQGFVANFGGKIQGRVPEGAGLAGFVDRTAKKVTKTYTRYVNGKAVTQKVEGADPMEFQKTELATGPITAYPTTTLTGSIDYDGEEGVWYVDMKASYTVEGANSTDRYSGTIRWNEDADRMKNGIGWYELNVRLNEQAATEADAFVETEGASAEDAFFAEDNSIPGFTGKIAYVDSFDDETVVASKVSYEVDANQASKIQIMNFAKVLMLMVGPFNDE